MKSSQSSRSLHKRSKSEDLKSFSQKQVSLKRRLSFDANNNRIFICNVKETIEKILLQEDTFKTFQITILSTGPKSISLGSFTSDGFKMYEIRGTYMISNLLQELSLAADCGLNYLIFEEGDISENPVDRLCRLIKTKFWDELTRRVDASGLVRICEDPKNSLQEFILYVPYFDSLALEYFQKVAIDRPLLKFSFLT